MLNSHPLRFEVHAHVQLHVLCDRLVELHPVLLKRRQPILGDWHLRGGSLLGTPKCW